MLQLPAGCVHLRARARFVLEDQPKFPMGSQQSTWTLTQQRTRCLGAARAEPQEAPSRHALQEAASHFCPQSPGSGSVQVAKPQHLPQSRRRRAPSWEAASLPGRKARKRGLVLLATRRCGLVRRSHRLHRPSSQPTRMSPAAAPGWLRTAGRHRRPRSPWLLSSLPVLPCWAPQKFHAASQPGTLPQRQRAGVPCPLVGLSPMVQGREGHKQGKQSPAKWRSKKQACQRLPPKTGW